MTLFSSPLPQPPASVKQPQRMKRYAYWYDGIIEWMLANPSGSLKDCAAALGKTPQTLYLVTNSDVFKLRYEQRRKEHFENLSQGILMRTARVAERSLEILEKRLEETPEKISTSQILETANSTLERLGYGTKAAPISQTNVTVNTAPSVAVTVSPDVLSDARERMRQVQAINAQAPEKAPSNLLEEPLGDVSKILDLEVVKDE